MSRIFHYLFRSSITRAMRYDCTHTAPCIAHLRILGVSEKFCTKPQEGGQKPKKKETKIIPKITLFQQNDMTITTLEEATKLARRRDLQLIKVQDIDPKSQRAVYKLATAAELLADDFEDSNSTKTSSLAKKSTSFKSLTIGSRIGDNDLNSRLKNVAKWLSKANEVRVLIQGANTDGKDSEKIFQKIEAYIKEPELMGKINQKRSKNGFIKFNIYPVALANSEAPSEKHKA